MISPELKEHLYKYISGILSEKKHKLYIINGISDHIHMLIGMRADCNLSVLVKEIKGSSSLHINKNRLTPNEFHWQTGYGAFSVSTSQKDKVIHYIENQKTHHEHTTFEDEFMKLLEAHGIEYDKKYVFD